MGHPLPDVAFKGHIAVVGMTGSGKTVTTKGIVEHIREEDPGARVCILDPIKSDWWGITSSASGKRAGLPFHILGGPRGHVPLHESTGAAIGELVGSGALPLSILDMADFGPGGLQAFFNDFAPALLRKIRGVVHLVLEEAHEFAPKERAGFGGETMTVHFAKKLATAGRSRGIRLIVATQRTQQLHNSVLGSCQTVIAHQLQFPADIEPVSKWFKAHVAKDVFDQFSETLPSLPTGTGWMCSGQAKVSAMVKFPMIRTFDNSATPDGADVIDVTTAPVDRDVLRQIMGDALKEAEASDVPALQAEIKRLKAEQASKANGVAPVDPAQLAEQFEAGRKVGYRAGQLFLRDRWKESLDRVYEAGQEAMAVLENDLASLPRMPVAEWAAAGSEVVAGQKLSPAKPLYLEEMETRLSMPTQGISKPQQRIIDALVWLEWIGRTGGVGKNLTAMLADQSPSSSGFRANLSTLSGAGLVVKAGDTVSLTDAGRAAANRIIGTRSSEIIHKAIQAKVSGPQWAMLLALIAAYPAKMAKDKVATASDQLPTSSGFRANLSTLSGLGFIDRERGSDNISASPILFV